MFHVGQLVLCVHGPIVPLTQWEIDAGVCEPTIGTVYTVRGFFDPDARDPGIFLEEIRNLSLQYRDSFGEPSFFASRFRPLDDSRLSIFREALTDKPVEVVS